MSKLSNCCKRIGGYKFFQNISYRFLLLALTISILQFSSCKNEYEIYRNDLNDVYLSIDNGSLLEGTYVTDSSKKSANIFNDFTGRALNKYTSEPNKLKMTLELKNAKQVDLIFWVDNELYKKRKLKGKFQDGYFYVNTKYSILRPLFPFIWGPARYYRRLGITETGKLVLLKEEIGYLMFVIVPSGKRCALSEKEYQAIIE